jgi:hypothetical protein
MVFFVFSSNGYGFFEGLSDFPNDRVQLTASEHAGGFALLPSPLHHGYRRGRWPDK